MLALDASECQGAKPLRLIGLLPFFLPAAAYPACVQGFYINFSFHGIME